MAKIDNAYMNVQLRVAIAEFIAQFVQPFLATRDEHERSCS